MSTETLGKSSCSVLPFTVEVDLPRNGHLSIQSIPGRSKLRSRFDPNKTVKFGGNGPDKDDEIIPKSMSDGAFNTHPKLPGQQIKVNPEKRTYEIIDPMYENKELCDKLSRWLTNNNVVGSNDRNGFPPIAGKLDIHRMKTLCRELYHVVRNGDGKIIAGSRFDLDDVDKLPGDYLSNPGSTIKNSQPKFEKDMEEWENRLGVLA